MHKSSSFFLLIKDNSMIELIITVLYKAEIRSLSNTRRNEWWRNAVDYVESLQTKDNKKKWRVFIHRNLQEIFTTKKFMPSHPTKIAHPKYSFIYSNHNYHRLIVFTLILQCTFDSSIAMRLVLQRVKSASVTVQDRGVVSSIGPGIMALVGLHQDDTEADLKSCCKQLLGAKLWENDAGKPWR